MRKETESMIREEQNRTDGEENHSSSWVVDLENLLADDDPESRRKEGERWEAQSIYWVPEWLKGTNSKAYKPQLVSLGPLHHGDTNVLPMEEHKRRALVRLIKRSERPVQDFISAIDEVAEELQAAYGKDLDVKWQNGTWSFVDMMLTDGCFLLEMMICNFSDYEPRDPVFSKSGWNSISYIVKSDMLLIENQLPLLVLKKILGVLPPNYLDACESRQEVEMDGMINLMVLDFLGRPDVSCDMANLSLSRHPLNLYHGSLTYREGAREVPEEWQEYKDQMMPSALEIHEAGIKFRKSKRDNLLEIDFKGGVLTMPEIVVHDDTESLYLNLMAFERLHFDVGDLVTAYVFFMDDMIVSANDVVMLSSNGVLENMLGCDKEVAKLFNGTLNRGQTLGPWHALHEMQCNVNAYCRKPWHKWRATLIRTYFRNPWAFISLAAAAILLIATLLQTVYTVKSSNS